MADAQQLLLCAPLCFAVKRINTLEKDLIFSALHGHYTVDEISIAKKQLRKDIDDMKLTQSLPRHTERYDVETKKKNEVNDIINMLQFLDHQKLLSRLPKYVADGPDAMPYFRIVDGDFKHVIRRMNTMEDMLRSVYAIIRSGSHGLHGAYTNPTVGQSTTSLGTSYAGLLQTNQSGNREQGFPISDFPVLNENTAAVSQASSLFRQAIQHASKTDRQSTVAHRPTSEKTRPSTASQQQTATTAAALAVRSSSQRDIMSSNRNTENETDTDEGGSTKYRLDAWQKRKEAKKRRRVRSAPDDNSEEQLSTKTTTARRKSKPLLVGRRTDESNKVSAAKSFERKFVYYVDNLNETVNTEDLTSFVAKLGVRVINCFEIQPRRSAQQKRDNFVDTNRRAFRLCINKADKLNMMKPDMWPADVLIKRWYWRKDENHSDDDILPQAGRVLSKNGAADDGCSDAQQPERQQQQQQTNNITDTEMEQTNLTDDHGDDGN
jgi:hypothetical protein